MYLVIVGGLAASFAGVGIFSLGYAMDVSGNDATRAWIVTVLASLAAALIGWRWLRGRSETLGRGARLATKIGAVGVTILFLPLVGLTLYGAVGLVT